MSVHPTNVDGDETHVESYPTTKTPFRNNGSCTNCRRHVSYDDLLPLHDGDKVKSFTCPNCLRDHFMVDG